HPWLRINRVLRLMLHTRWSAAAWSQVRVEFKEGARAQEPDPARRVVQLIVTDRLGRLLLVTLEVARGRPRCADRYRPACELRRGRLRRASLYIPELETHNVKRNGPPGAPATRQSDLFHRLILRNRRVAGAGRRPCALRIAFAFCVFYGPACATCRFLGREATCPTHFSLP